MKEEEIEKAINNLQEKDIRAINGLADFFNGVSGANIEKLKIPCEYCEDIVNKSIRSANWNGNGQINITKTGNLYGKDDEVFIINYCPMCRKEVELGGRNYVGSMDGKYTNK